MAWRAEYSTLAIAEKISRANICVSTGLYPQPEGSLEARRLSLTRLSRCVIHSPPGSNNTVRKGTCYRLSGKGTQPASRPIHLARRLNFFHDLPYSRRIGRYVTPINARCVWIIAFPQRSFHRTHCVRRREHIELCLTSPRSYCRQ